MLFRAYQTMRYVDTEIPHIPIRAAGLPDTDLYTISTTNWMPYDMVAEQRCPARTHAHESGVLAGRAGRMRLFGSGKVRW